jgi:hypothetical protein
MWVTESSEWKDIHHDTSYEQASEKQTSKCIYESEWKTSLNLAWMTHCWQLNNIRNNSVYLAMWYQQ